MEKFIENKGRNIHSAGGSSGTDYKSKGKTNSDTAENRTKKNIIGKIIISENSVAYFEKNRIAERAEYRRHCKSFSKDKISHAKHYNVKNKNKSRNRNMKKMFNNKSNTGSSAKSNSGRKNKKLDCKCINYVSNDNTEKRKQLFQFLL